MATPACHLHHPLDRLHLVAFAVRREQVALAVRDVSQERRPPDFIPGHELAALQVRNGDGRPRGERMLRMAHEHEPFVAERVNGQSRQPPGIADQAEVHRVFQHLSVHPVNEAMADIDLDGGKIPLELFQARRQLVQEDAVADAQFDAAPDGVTDFLHAPDRIGVEPDNLRGVLVISFPRPGQLKLMAASQNEHFAGVAFQMVEHLGDGGCRDGIPFGRAGEVLGFDEITEQLQVFNLHQNQ
jgi:hypothetical protein